MGTEKKKNLRSLPVLPLRDRVIFPDTIVTVDAERNCSVRAIALADQQDKTVFVCAQRGDETEGVTADGLYTVGCVCRIRRAGGLLNNRVTVESLYRAVAERILEEDGVFLAECEEIRSVSTDPEMEEAYFRAVRALVKDVCKRDVTQTDSLLSKELWSQLDSCGEIDRYINMAASGMRIKKPVRQELLEERRVLERLQLFQRCVSDELEISKLEQKISTAVRKNIDQAQKEYYLREQLRVIKKELGEDENDLVELKKKVEEKRLP